MFNMQNAKNLAFDTSYASALGLPFESLIIVSLICLVRAYELNF